MPTDINEVIRREAIQQIDASPAYDVTEEIDFSLGDSENFGSVVVLTPVAGRWNYSAVKINLMPGVYKLSETSGFVSNAQASNCDSIRFRLYKKVGTDLIYETGTEVDMTPDQPATTTARITSDLGDIEFTIVDGDEWYYSVALHNIADTGTNAGYRATAAGTAPTPGEAYFISSDSQFDTGPNDLPTTVDVSGKSYSTSLLKFRVSFTTSNRILFEGEYSAATRLTIPYIRSGHDNWIKFEDVVVADGEALTCEFQHFDSGAAVTRETMVLDMGATDQVTYNGNNVALNAVTSEAGDRFDLGVNLRPDTSKSDLFYINRDIGQGGQGDTDIATISHACKNGSARDLDYSTTGDTPFLNLSGTATVAKIQIGWQPTIMFGDSQTAWLGDLIRLGAQVPTAFTYDRMWWVAGISGNRLSEITTGYHTAGYQRYRNDTPGLGDITEMTGAILCVNSFGVNDLAQVDAPERRDIIVSRMMQRLSEIMKDRSNKEQDTLFIGLPPYSAVAATEDQAQSVRQWDRGLHGLAASTRTPFYTPWAEMVDGSYDVPIPVFNAIYTDDGTHYNTDGALFASAKAIVQYEAGTTPDRVKQS